MQGKTTGSLNCCTYLHFAPPPIHLVTESKEKYSLHSDMGSKWLTPMWQRWSLMIGQSGTKCRLHEKGKESLALCKCQDATWLPAAVAGDRKDYNMCGWGGSNYVNLLVYLAWAMYRLKKKNSAYYWELLYKAGKWNFINRIHYLVCSILPEKAFKLSIVPSGRWWNLLISTGGCLQLSTVDNGKVK